MEKFIELFDFQILEPNNISNSRFEIREEKYKQSITIDLLQYYVKTILVFSSKNKENLEEMGII